MASGETGDAAFKRVGQPLGAATKFVWPRRPLAPRRGGLPRVQTFDSDPREDQAYDAVLRRAIWRERTMATSAHRRLSMESVAAAVSTDRNSLP